MFHQLYHSRSHRSLTSSSSWYLSAYGVVYGQLTDFNDIFRDGRGTFAGGRAWFETFNDPICSVLIPTVTANLCLDS